MFNNYPEFYWRVKSDTKHIAEFYIGKNRYKALFQWCQVWDEDEEKGTAIPNNNKSFWEFTYGAASIDGHIHYEPEHETNALQVFGALFYILYNFTQENPEVREIRYTVSSKQKSLINRYIERRLESHFPEFEMTYDYDTVILKRK